MGRDRICLYETQLPVRGEPGIEIFDLVGKIEALKSEMGGHAVAARVELFLEVTEKSPGPAVYFFKQLGQPQGGAIILRDIEGA